MAARRRDKQFFDRVAGPALAKRFGLSEDGRGRLVGAVRGFDVRVEVINESGGGEFGNSTIRTVLAATLPGWPTTSQLTLRVLQGSARRGGLPERPMIELTLPSSLDDGLAPPGRHVASLFVQHVPWAPEGGGWEAQREPFADRVLALLDEVAPGFSASVLHREVLAPPDLERVFGLTGGNLFHGAMTPNRLFLMRPVPGATGYATPLPGLYLCGAGTHPGGGVMGACGRNAAAAVLRHLGRRPG